VAFICRGIPSAKERDSISHMMPTRWCLFVALVLGAGRAGAADMVVNLRSRVEAFKGSGDWREVRLQQSLAAQKTAVLICDMWDKPWCRGATERVGGAFRDHCQCRCLVLNRVKKG
jgi:hypothetical protein